jgi:lysylphosphatidylglycerol synthetase-like protein (DUF2156 family)
MGERKSPHIPCGKVNNVTVLLSAVLMLLSFLQVEQLTVLWILFSLIVVGNSAVLVTLYLNKRRKSRMNFFIMQLAAAGHCQVLVLKTSVCASFPFPLLSFLLLDDHANFYSCTVHVGTILTYQFV